MPIFEGIEENFFDKADIWNTAENSIKSSCNRDYIFTYILSWYLEKISINKTDYLFVCCQFQICPFNLISFAFSAN